MALAPAITDLEQLKTHPAVARLLAWNAAAVTGAKFDRGDDDLRGSCEPARGLRPAAR